MSDDLLRTARQLLSVLEAGEAYLRTAASESLSFSRILAVERRANQRCSEILAQLGAADDFRVDDATDELLLGLSRLLPPTSREVPMPGASGSPVRQSTGNARVDSMSTSALVSYEPLDDGSEISASASWGSAETGNSLRNEEAIRQGAPGRSDASSKAGSDPSSSSITAGKSLSARSKSLSSSPASSKSPVQTSASATPQPADADTSEIARAKSSASASQAASGQGNSVGAAMAAALEAYVTFDEDHSPSDEEPTLNDARAVARGEDPFANLVQFDIPVPPTPETVQRVATPPKKSESSRADASDTFDLIPDMSNDDLSSFEAEEVTVVKSADAVADMLDGKSRGRTSSSTSASSLSGSSSQVGKTVARAETPPPAASRTASAKPTSGSSRSARSDSLRSETSKTDLGRSQPRPETRSTPTGASARTASQASGISATGRSPRSSPPSSSGSQHSLPKAVSSSAAPASQHSLPRAIPGGSASSSSSRTPSVPPRSGRTGGTAEPAAPRTSRPSQGGSPGPTPGPAPQRGSAPTSASVPTAAARGSGASLRVGTSKGSSSTGPGANRVTSGLYGGAQVPTIRDSDEPRPRAAAIQLNPSGTGGRVIGLEEEDEPIEIGEAEGLDPDAFDNGGGGFSLQLHNQDDLRDDDDDDFDNGNDGELAAEDLEVIQPAQPTHTAPTAEEIAQLLNRARAAAQGGDLQGSADLYSDVIDAAPDHVGAHVARGRLYLDLGDYSRAMSDFLVAEDLAPNDPEPQVAIGDLFFHRKDYRKAIDFFNAALQLAPNHAMAFCRRGISHYYRKNYKEAVEDLLRSERLDPDIPNIQTYVSMAKKKVKAR